MLLMILVAVVLIGSLVAIVFAMIVVSKNKKIQKNAPELTTQAKVLSTYSTSYESHTVDSSNARTTSTYHVDFLLEDKSKKTFKIKKKFFLSLNDGEEGILLYKGDKIIEFKTSELERN